MTDTISGSGTIDAVIPAETIQQRILLMRGHKVMLSTDLAELYGVEVRTLVQAVKRNIRRFPPDFMFHLTEQEFANLKSQIVISSWGGMRRGTPYAFTEQGVAMLSSVLRSERAVQVNIAVMRTFVQLRRFIASHSELSYKLDELERRLDSHDEQIALLMSAIRELMVPADEDSRRIGFRSEETV